MIMLKITILKMEFSNDFDLIRYCLQVCENTKEANNLYRFKKQSYDRN